VTFDIKLYKKFKQAVCKIFANSIWHIYIFDCLWHVSNAICVSGLHIFDCPNDFINTNLAMIYFAKYSDMPNAICKYKIYNPETQVTLDTCQGQSKIYNPEAQVTLDT
jgi:hypothetical protein